MKILIPEVNKDQDINISSVGRKGYNLLQMYNFGLSVPKFIFIPVETIQIIIEPELENIQSILSEIDHNSEESPVKSYNKIREIILNSNVPVGIEELIKITCKRIFGENYSVAIRSSALNEDSKDVSFAGQYSSYMFVSEEFIVSKILECIASAWNPGVYFYKKSKQINTVSADIAVVIQQMVDAEKSGISFSVDISHNMADMLIVAGFGLGEGIVNDRTDTDNYIINRQSEEITTAINRKESRLVYKEKKLIADQVPEELRFSAVLKESEIKDVSANTLIAEKLLGCPADVEFSFDTNGKLFILQMRPVTGINFEDTLILDNTNIVESYPGLTLPLSYSFALEAYKIVFRSSSRKFWLSGREFEDNINVFNNLIALFNGRIYYRLDNWYKMIRLVYRSKKSMHEWENAIGLKDSQNIFKGSGLGRKIKMTLASLFMLISYKSSTQKFFKKFNLSYNNFRNPEIVNYGSLEIWNHYKKYTSEMFTYWYSTILNDFIAFKVYNWLNITINKLKKNTNENLANDLISNMEDVESELAVRKVFELKESITNNKELVQLFSLPTKEIQNNLHIEKYRHFYNQILEYIDIYGDRTLAELKLETKSFRQDPHKFIQLLKSQLDCDIDLKKYIESKNTFREKTNLQFKSTVKKWSPKYYLIRVLIHYASMALKNRENMRFCRARAYGAVKDLFLLIGKRMQSDDLLKEPEDVFYLEVEILRDYCMGNKLEKLMELVKKNKAQYKEYQDVELPDRIIYVKGNTPGFTSSNPTDLDKNILLGTAVSKGIVTAEAVVISQPSYEIDVAGKIIVTKMTDPGWVFLMTKAAGIISEKGSLLSHTAIVGRELQIPVVVGVNKATSIIKTGDIIRLNGNNGEVIRQ